MKTVLGLAGSLSPALSHAQIWIEEQQQAEFPLTLIPDTRKKIVLSPDGQIGGSSNAEVVGGSALSGHYIVSSDSNRTISVNLSSNNDDPNIELKSFEVIYKGVTYKNFPAEGLPSPGNGSDLFIGITAILKRSAGEGVRLPSYTIDIVEE